MHHTRMFVVQTMYFAEKFLVHLSPPEPAAHEYSSVWGGVCGWVWDGGVRWGILKKKKFQKKKISKQKNFKKKKKISKKKKKK